ncbi:hypothetical protein MCG98_05905 [Ruminococcus sp. OA3]|uniref:hypothetical protein n=1 Tax=Ruminococcus sp. OA3 TaxID=2914164 RepID=UPI001F061681|nr:hypothetical protein [Ruminococcus sp. OA3]MCH1982097.1 hypothetical protein [Ruminococcus sp. OA3]
MLLTIKELKGKFIFLVCLFTILIFSCVLEVNAASKFNESVESFFFTTPRGQTASVRARATISETYSSSGSNSTFTYRDCFLCYNRAYSASAPEITRMNGSHKTSATGSTVRTFSPWTRGSYLWDVGTYPNGGGSYNQTSVTYPKSTTNVSGFPYTVYCNGSIVPTRAGSVYVSLKTN